MSDSAPAPVLLISPDLFFTSRVTGTASSLNVPVEVVSSAAAGLTRVGNGEYRAILVDLESHPLAVADLIQQRGERTTPVIAFGPHVQTARLEEARLAGCTEVMSRGQFSAQLPQILQQFVEPAA